MIYPEAGSYRILPFSKQPSGTDGFDLRFCQASPIVSFTPSSNTQSVFKRMFCIGRCCNPFKIFKSIVHSVAVAMISLHCSWGIALECLQNKAMEQSRYRVIRMRKTNQGIPPTPRLQYASRTDISHLAQGTNFIRPFIACYRMPVFSKHDTIILCQ